MILAPNDQGNRLERLVMPVLAGVKMFVVGRRSVTMTTLADDKDEERVVAIKVRVDDRLVGTLSGDWPFEDETAMEKAALSYIARQGIALHDSWATEDH